MKHLTTTWISLTLLTVTALPVRAQSPDFTVTTKSTNPWIAQQRQVEPLPFGCEFDAVWVDGVPRTRPAMQLTNSPPSGVAFAQVVPTVPLPPGDRQVAYFYDFPRLRLQMQPFDQGVFLIDSVRTIVHMGPTSAYPVASDRTVARTDPVRFSNSVTQHLASGDGSYYINNTWLIRNISNGRWQPGPNAPTTHAQVHIACLVRVVPARRP